MARSMFGGTSGDFIATVGPGGTVRAVPGNLTMWSAETGGTQYADLLLDGAPATSIPVARDGQVPAFEGPDGVATMWADAGIGKRVRLLSDKTGAELASDAFMAATAADPGSDFSTTLTGQFAPGGAAGNIDATEAVTVAEARISTRVGELPSWATGVKTYDARLHTYNLRPETMPQWRKARADVEAGTGQAHVSTFLDSIMYGAASTGVSVPKHLHSIAGRLRNLFDRRWDSAGTGIVVPFDTTFSNPTYDPRLVYGGTVANFALGPHQIAAARWQSGGVGDPNYVEFTATCTEFIVYGVGNASRLRVQVDGGAEKYIANVNGLDPSLTDYDPEPGYPIHGTSGQIVTHIPAGTLGSHTLRILAPSNGTDYANIIGVEGRTSDAGVRVTQMARSGLKMQEFIRDDPTTDHYGMATSLDMPRSNLAVMLLCMNDFQAHVPVATFKSRVETVVQRQRSTATYRAGGDVLLVTCPQPNYAAPIPGDGIQTPPLTDYYSALYEVADEQNVALLDVAARLEDYSTSAGLGFYADPLHLNDRGSADVAAAVYAALMAV